MRVPAFPARAVPVRTVVVVGPHGVGKTTLGRLLAERLGCPFHPEVGERLAADPAWRDPGAAADAPQAAFDRRVFVEEFARDLAWEAAGGGLRVVETWHPGNLAYALRRSPAEAARWLAAVRERPAWAGVLPVVLTASPAVLARRQHEPGDPAFFAEVGRLAGALAVALAPAPAVFLDTGAAPPETLAALVCDLAGPASLAGSR